MGPVRKTSSLTERRTKMCRFSTYLASSRPPTWGSVSLLIDLASDLSHRSGQFLSSARTASAGRSDSLGAVLVRGHKMHTSAANPVTELRRSLPVAERMSAHRAPRGDRLLSFTYQWPGMALSRREGGRRRLGDASPKTGCCGGTRFHHVGGERLGPLRVGRRPRSGTCTWRRRGSCLWSHRADGGVRLLRYCPANCRGCGGGGSAIARSRG